MRAFHGPEGEIAVCPIPTVGWYIVAVQPLFLMDYLNTGMTFLFLAIMGIIIIFFIILQVGKYAFDILNRTRQELRIERDIIATMKDNLSVGLFLMDKDYSIQGSYSKSLESILGANEIEGKKLTDFLVSSFNTKDMDSLKKYFNMVLTRKHDTKMLEEINPIGEFSYSDENNMGEKILKTGFSSVDMGENNVFILGTLEDISLTKELERQLKEEANKREEDMQALFQVIQIDSTEFEEFLEDTESTFDQINETLKNKTYSTKDAMIRIFQSVHAIKSNSVILGLNNFSATLHELENSIKKFRDDDDITFDNMLYVAQELEKIMREKDKYRNVTSKIESFKTGSAIGSTRQDQNVLIETLTKACEKAAQALNKKVKFTVDNLDTAIYEKGPRRIIKEILTQLVRNSVYHGIEAPGDRKAAGKEAEGTIRLAITRENNQIHIELSDDGRGLNFQEIREKALNLKLLRKEDSNDKGQLLKVLFSPGFSTAGSADVHAGRGIGLNLVRDRLKELGGTIKLSSEPGKGICFHLYIPIT
jgi:two-component system chemotaxis sensor kinase CheA